MIRLKQSTICLILGLCLIWISSLNAEAMPSMQASRANTIPMSQSTTIGGTIPQPTPSMTEPSATSTPATSTSAPSQSPTLSPMPSLTVISTLDRSPTTAEAPIVPDRLSFVVNTMDANPEAQRVVLREIEADFAVTVSDEWLTVIRPVEWLTEGAAIRISVDASKLPPAVEQVEGSVTVHLNRPLAKQIGIPVNVAIRRTASLEVQRTALSFSAFQNETIPLQILPLGNRSRQSIAWSATTSHPWITLSTSRGEINAKGMEMVEVEVNPTILRSTGTYTATVNILTVASEHSVAVHLSVVPWNNARVELESFEITQGLQSLANDIPLIADRPTFVRAHMRSLTGGPVPGVSARLIGLRNGVQIGSITASNTNGQVTALPDPDRAQLNDSLLFELPSDWLGNGLSLHLIGDSIPIRCAETSTLPGDVAGDCQTVLTFEPAVTLPLRLYLGHDQKTAAVAGQPTYNYQATFGDAVSALQYLLAYLPISSIDWTVGTTPLIQPELRDGHEDSNLPALNSVRTLWDLANRPQELYLGLFASHAAQTTDESGLSSPAQTSSSLSVLDGFSAIADYRSDGEEALLGQAVGRLLGQHTISCTTGPADTFPNPLGQISQHIDSSSHFGFDIVHRRVLPSSHRDVMGDCRPVWTSDVTFRAVSDWLQQTFGVEQRYGTRKLAQSGDEVLHITGHIASSGTAQIDIVRHLTADVDITEFAEGPYLLRLLNEQGYEIALYRFQAQPLMGQTITASPASYRAKTQVFSLIVPFVEGLSRLELIRDGQIMDAHERSAHAPIVNITSPNGGETFSHEDVNNSTMNIAWSASDTDGDRLTYDVDYSTDNGVSWSPLAIGLTNTSLRVDVGQLPGSGLAQVRVSAHDGFRTSRDVTNGAFFVDDKPPQALILHHGRQTYTGGQIINFAGVGLDLEDRRVVQLRWLSDRQGELGQGEQLTLSADALVTGTHTIMLQATDNLGQRSNSDDSLSYTRPNHPHNTDVLVVEIGRSPTDSVKGLQVAPSALSFIAQGAGISNVDLLTHEVSIRSKGSDDLEWEATIDAPVTSTSSHHIDDIRAPVLTLSRSSGTTPDRIVVTVDTTGLTPGHYAGDIHIQVPSTQEKGSDTMESVMVPYYLSVISETTHLYLPIIAR